MVMPVRLLGLLIAGLAGFLIGAIAMTQPDIRYWVMVLSIVLASIGVLLGTIYLATRVIRLAWRDSPGRPKLID